MVKECGAFTEEGMMDKTDGRDDNRRNERSAV
jgi:hypothetical protein